MKPRLRAWLGRVLSFSLTLGFGLRRMIGGRRTPPAAPRLVLIVRFDLMGDVVNGLSAAMAARSKGVAPVPIRGSMNRPLLPPRLGR